jgi:glycosyltransferase involved in cell wall biosynthesis
MTATITPPTVDLPAGLRTLAVLHLAEVSGPSRTLRPRLERLAGHGDVEVVVPGPGGAAESYRDIARITTLDYRPLSFPGAAGDLAAIALRLAREARMFRRHLREAQPDLVVIATATLPSALVAARLERLPVIVKLAEIFDKGHVQSPTRTLAGQATLTLHRALADVLICSSKAVAAQLRRPGRARVLPLYPGISQDHADGDGSGFRAAHGLDDADPLIAVVGNIAAGRGQDLAVRALDLLRERFPRAACAFVGTPHPNVLDRQFCNDVIQLAADLGLPDRVVLAGFVERVADVYAAADVVVNPARFNEPFGRVAPEALVARCPVVATRVGAIPEVMRDGVDALIVDPESPAAIAQAVTRLVEDPVLADGLVEEGRARALQEFSEERGADEFERVAAELFGAVERIDRAPALA